MANRKATTPETKDAIAWSADAGNIPGGYGELLEDLKARIRAARVKAALSVNRELIALYWHIGKSIVERQRTAGWGKAVVERLAADLQDSFPGLEGFSARNIWHTRSFYLAYEPTGRKLKQPVSELGREKLAQPARESESAILPRPVSEIPWGHNIVLLQKLKDPAARLWYARQTVENGWSRAMLTHWIESGLHERQGKAVTNFKAALPAPQSDLAAEIVRDPYNFDFLTLRTDAAERDLERGLLDHIRKFLLELGSGFAFVGQQVHLDVDGEDFYLDLLFYHLRLRCYVVIDLKARPFKPEHAGKMNFYLSAVDELLRHPGDKPSIGIILCKTRSRVIAEYALRDLTKPVGVARYKTRLVEILPDNLKGKLPPVERIKAELAGADEPRPKISSVRSVRRRRKGEIMNGPQSPNRLFDYTNQ
ncbi:MAG: PDDEXK nuclease domain-containing protein [Planctomycetota bacterium]|jgi:predicted nuclease of restriction endonuclease-like (RecB) superfamily|nr:PDDEXK nuclease domain-containing protein [Planctomycetota bacterium]